MMTIEETRQASMQQQTEMKETSPSQHEHVRVHVREAPDPEPMSPEEVRAANAESFALGADFVGPQVAEKALDIFVSEIASASEKAKRQPATKKLTGLERIR